MKNIRKELLTDSSWNIAKLKKANFFAVTSCSIRAKNTYIKSKLFYGYKIISEI